MCEVVGVGLYLKLIGTIMGVVCEVVLGFYMRLFLLDVGESNSVNSGTEVFIENVCIKWHVL